MKVMKWVLIFMFSTALLYGAEESKLFVTYKIARVFSKASAYSKQRARLPFGSGVQVKGGKGLWVKITYKKNKKWKKGFIHQDALVDEKRINRQADKVTGGKAAIKGFSQDEDIGNSVKGFSEEEDAGASVKGFNPDVEKKYKSQNQSLQAAYKMVSQIDREGEIVNLKKEYKSFRKKGRLGEYGPLYPFKRKRKKKGKKKK